MDRKKFIGSALPLAAVLQGFTSLQQEEEIPLWAPPYLKKGDRIAITCPSGYITTEDIEPAVSKLKEWGFDVVTGSTVGKRDFTFGGTDAERTADFQSLLNDTTLKAILCARGGYGAVRIIDQLNFAPLLKHPKWIIGFSDATVLHAHLQRRLGLASIHSKMCNSFPKNWAEAEPVQQQSIESIFQCLTGREMQYDFPANNANIQGTATGILAGGNLKILETLAGTKSDLPTAGKILFVEDTNEYLYNIDRMFWNLLRSGKLSQLKGLIIGGFKVKPSEDPAEEFGKTLTEIVLEKTSRFGYPVCFDFPVGHQKNNQALKCGMLHTLTVKDTLCNLKEKR